MPPRHSIRQRNQRPLIRSDGTFVRDYFYVEDGAAAYMFLAEQLARRPDLAGHAFNLSTEIQLSVTEIAQKVLDVMGSNLEPEILGQACHEIPHQYLCAQKAREMLGWRPLFTLEEGLKRTVEWYANLLQPTSIPHPMTWPATAPRKSA